MVRFMKKNVLLLSLALSIVCFFGLSYSENCMWNQTCEDDRYNLEFCGNGRCEPFETKRTCVEDCGSILDSVIYSIRTHADGISGGSGIFGGVQGSAIVLMLVMLVAVVVLGILGLILIVVYNKVVASIEKEIIID